MPDQHYIPEDVLAGSGAENQQEGGGPFTNPWGGPTYPRGCPRTTSKLIPATRSPGSDTEELNLMDMYSFQSMAYPIPPLGMLSADMSNMYATPGGLRSFPSGTHISKDYRQMSEPPSLRTYTPTNSPATPPPYSCIGPSANEPYHGLYRSYFSYSHPIPNGSDVNGETDRMNPACPSSPMSMSLRFDFDAPLSPTFGESLPVEEPVPTTAQQYPGKEGNELYTVLNNRVNLYADGGKPDGGEVDDVKVVKPGTSANKPYIAKSDSFNLFEEVPKVPRRRSSLRMPSLRRRSKSCGKITVPGGTDLARGNNYENNSNGQSEVGYLEADESWVQVQLCPICQHEQPDCFCHTNSEDMVLLNERELQPSPAPSQRSGHWSRLCGLR